MKKNLFFAALAAVALVSCSSEDLVEEVVDEEVAIDFAADAQKTTRAAISSNSDLATEGGFIVYGYKKATSDADWSAAQTIFDAVNVTASANNGAYISGSETNWTYSPKKYWDKNGTYCFYAVAPASPAHGTYSVTDAAANAKMITITGATSAKSTDSDDHLISRAGVLNRLGSNQTDNVDFTFNHVMAKLSFKVQRQDDVDATITVTEVKMTGWNSNTGTFTQNSTAVPTDIQCDEWTQTAGTAGSFTLVGTGCGDTSIALSNNTAVGVKDWYIMVPQTVAALKFEVKYTLSYTAAQTGSSEYSEDFVVDGTLGTAQTWGTDSYTTYTIKVGPKPIEFDVVEVAGWTKSQDGGTVSVN